VGSGAEVGTGLDGDGVPTLEVGDGTRSDVADVGFEASGPIVRGFGTRVDVVEDEVDVATSLASAFAEDELGGEGALAPVDVAGIVAVAHRADGDDFVAEAPLGRGATAGEVAWEVGRQAERIDGGVDDQLPLGGELAGFLE
jgi:hypothetical protein